MFKNGRNTRNKWGIRFVGSNGENQPTTGNYMEAKLDNSGLMAQIVRFLISKLKIVAAAKKRTGETE
jgi:hypothetical protein